jgi:hypothetical protein
MKTNEEKNGLNVSEIEKEINQTLLCTQSPWKTSEPT